MRKHLLFVVLAGVMSTACTDDLEPEVTPVGPSTFNDDIPHHGNSRRLLRKQQSA